MPSKSWSYVNIPKRTDIGASEDGDMGGWMAHPSASPLFIISSTIIPYLGRGTHIVGPCSLFSLEQKSRGRMSEIALSPGSSAAPPLATEDKPDVDATVAPSVLGPEADQAAPLEPSASTITPAKKSKPKKKSTAQARASEVVKDETSSQAGDANMGSPAPSAVGAESALGQSGIGLGIADGAVEAVPQPGGIEGEGQAPAGPSALPASVKKPTKAAPKRSAPKVSAQTY